MHSTHLTLLLLLLLTTLSCTCDRHHDRSSRRKPVEEKYNPIQITAARLETPKPIANRSTKRVPCKRTEGTYPGYHEVPRKFNFYEPKNADQSRPLIIFLHEGAFVAGDQDDYITNQFCTDFARLGYATAAIEYTIAKNFNGLRDIALPAKYIKNKIYEAFRDTQAAIRFFKSNAAGFHIDPNRIFVSGFSAGAVLSLHCAFLDAEEAAEYFGKDDPFERESLAGIVGISGGVFNLGQVDDEENPPLLLLHGSEDDMIPFGSGQPLERFRHDIDIDLPGFLLAIGISDRTPEGEMVENRVISAPDWGFHLPKWMPAFIINCLTDEIYGSKAIYDRAFDNCTFIPVKDGNHTF